MPESGLLVIDIGNSSLKWALTDFSIASTNSINMQQQLLPELVNSEYFESIWINLDKPTVILASSVTSEEKWLALENACENLWQLNAQRVKASDKGYGLKNAYIQPQDLGSDRWSAMIGAYQLLKSDIMIVSCGSAMTIDVVDATGTHLGGYILPGLDMMKQSLGNNTAKVGLVTEKPENLSLEPESTTASCVNAAVHLASIKLIEAVYNQQIKRAKEIKCILSGGNAELISSLMALECIVAPDLVLRGLAYIANQTETITLGQV